MRKRLKGSSLPKYHNTICTSHMEASDVISSFQKPANHWVLPYLHSIYHMYCGQIKSVICKHLVIALLMQLGQKISNICYRSWNGITTPSWRPYPLTESVDAFLQDWSKVRGYANSLWSLIGQVLKKVQVQEAQIVLVTPVWTGIQSCWTWYQITHNFSPHRSLCCRGSRKLTPVSQMACLRQIQK